jgi:hypothetical protein
MGKRYGKLPSELIVQGDTFDLMVMDVALNYQHYVNEKAQGKVDPKTYDRMYGQDELANRLKKARKETDDNII